MTSLAQFHAGRLMLRWACVQQVASRALGQGGRFRLMLLPFRGANVLSGKTRATPATVRLHGGRPVIGSCGGLLGEYHGVVVARPHDLTVPSAQGWLVFPDSTAPSGMILRDFEWVLFEALRLQDQALVAHWVQEGADVTDFAQASIALLGCDTGSWSIHCYTGCAKSSGPQPGAAVRLGRREGLIGSQIGPQSKLPFQHIQHACVGSGLAILKHLQFTSASLFPKRGSNVGALRACCCSGYHTMLLSFAYLDGAKNRPTEKACDPST